MPQNTTNSIEGLLNAKLQKLALKNVFFFIFIYSYLYFYFFIYLFDQAKLVRKKKKKKEKKRNSKSVAVLRRHLTKSEICACLKDRFTGAKEKFCLT